MIVREAVVYDQSNIGYKVLPICVHAVVELRLRRGEVHRLFDDATVAVEVSTRRKNEYYTLWCMVSDRVDRNPEVKTCSMCHLFSVIVGV